MKIEPMTSEALGEVRVIAAATEKRHPRRTISAAEPGGTRPGIGSVLTRVIKASTRKGAGSAGEYDAL